MTKRCSLINTKYCVDQMEFLLGKKIPKKYWKDLPRCFHLNTPTHGVLNALKLMGKRIDDVIYEEDRKILRKLI